MAEPSKTNKERLKEITDGIEQGITDLFQSDKYAQFLQTMSRFHRYSVNNTMLIYMQKPDATLVAGYNKWRDQFERHVKKGEKGIQIIAPTPLKKRIEMQKLDPDTQAPVLDSEGKIVTEEKEIQIPLFKPVTVFDVSQTDGKPLPQLATDLSGNVERYDLFMAALRLASPVPIHIETMTGTMDGYFDLNNQDIAIRKGMSEVQTVSAVIHEIGHAKLHNYEQERLTTPVKEGAEPPPPKDRRTEEVEAESISYAVCQYYGIQTGDNSFGYIASWSKDKTLPELRASLDTINKAASAIISDVDYHYRAVVKEYDTVITEWATDFANYIYENSGDALIIATRDELIKDAFEDIKSGDIDLPKGRLQELSFNSEAPADDLLQRLAAIERNYPPAQREAVYLLDGESYLHLKTADEGYNYTLYDKSLREIDGGFIDDMGISLDDAYVAALEIQNMHPESAEKVSLGILDDIAAVLAQDIEQYKREHNIDQPAAAAAEPFSMSEVERWEDDQIMSFTVTEQTVKSPIIPAAEPAEPEQFYDYPMPDPAIGLSEMNLYGYTDENMLPLTMERALELYDHDLTIYMLYSDNTEAMVFDKDEVITFGADGIFGVPYGEWELAKDELAPKQESQAIDEQAFTDTPDAYCIYQVKHGELYRDYRFEALDSLQDQGLAVDRDNYNFIYAAPLAGNGSTGQTLEAIYKQFNVAHPADFKGHSLSMSDIVALNQGGKVSYHYCDTVGFVELPGFDSGKNPLRSVEDSIEQNDNNLDGIINNTHTPSVSELEAQARAGRQISLMDLARATHEDSRKEKKPSVLDRLKQPATPQEHKKSAPKKSAEMEL